MRVVVLMVLVAGACGAASRGASSEVVIPEWRWAEGGVLVLDHRSDVSAPVEATMISRSEWTMTALEGPTVTRARVCVTEERVVVPEKSIAQPLEGRCAAMRWTPWEDPIVEPGDLEGLDERGRELAKALALMIPGIEAYRRLLAGRFRRGVPRPLSAEELYRFFRSRDAASATLTLVDVDRERHARIRIEIRDARFIHFDGKPHQLTTRTDHLVRLSDGALLETEGEGSMGAVGEAPFVYRDRTTYERR